MIGHGPNSLFVAARGGVVPGGVPPCGASVTGPEASAIHAVVGRSPISVGLAGHTREKGTEDPPEEDEGGVAKVRTAAVVGAGRSGEASFPERAGSA